MVDPLSGTDLSTISAGGTKANPVSIQENDVIACIGEMQCCRQTGEPGTDDADIGGKAADSLRKRGCSLGRRCVIGGGIVANPIIGREDIHHAVGQAAL